MRWEAAAVEGLGEISPRRPRVADRWRVNGGFRQTLMFCQPPMRPVAKY
jgi:hypothetical protein